LDTILKEEDVVGIFRTYLFKKAAQKKKSVNSSSKTTELEVDVVAGGGLRWIKVKAMNPVNMDILTKQGSSSNKGRTT